MYCESCGSRIADDSLFCESCGRSVNALPNRVRKAQPQRKGRYRKKKKSVGLKIVKLIAIVVVVTVAIFACSAIFSEKSDVGAENNISLVQNGYLGEYTDIAVKELLDGYYGVLYEESEWDGGVTDSGAMIVQAKYYGEGLQDEPTTIQFTMLDEECFKITAFVDPLNPIDKPTDLYAAMNYNYLLAYMGQNRSVAGDPEAEKALIDRLDSISGSAVQYGASADYSGDRATICKIDGQTPLGVSVVMLLDNYGLLDMSYYWEPETSGSTEPTQTQETEPTSSATEPSEVPKDDAESMLMAVLKGERTFIMSESGESLSIYQICKLGEIEFDAPLIPFQYAYVDMDQDGQQEAIVDLTNGWRMILRYQDGVVYGYGYGFRGLQSISRNGLAMGSSGAAYTDIFRLHFDGGDVREEFLSSVESENAMEKWIEVEWYDYGKIFSGSDSSAGASGEYPLNLVNGSTGDVVNALGKEYIYGGGYSGSKLFYYGSQPDIQYGFVPYNWENPVFTGSEPITVIILSGDVQINAYLSADMNKAELDAVAWETPDVQNVSNGNEYTMMSGSTYRYKIETSSAMILYTWYLDDGDSIEFAASEVIIVPM